MRRPLASVDELADQTTVVLDTDEAVALANSMLRQASALVRSHGDENWEDYTAPEIAITVTIAAAARGFLNPAGYSLERGDMLTVQRGDSAVAGVALTPYEIERISAAIGLGGPIGVVDVQRDVRVSDCYYPINWWEWDETFSSC